MALTENLDIFLADFGVSCTAGAVTAVGILDMPTEVVAGDMMLSTDYVLTAKSSDFGDLVYNSQITVNGTAFTVRDNRLTGDGMFCELSLQRSVETPITTSTTAIDGGDVDDTVDDLGLEKLDPELDGGSAGSSYIEGNTVDGGAA